MEQILQLRKQALELLGGKCKRCGFKDRRALHFDHVNGNGAEERRKEGNRQHLLMYRRIIAGERNLYQILCANCNCIKKVENKEHNVSNYSQFSSRLKKYNLWMDSQNHSD